MLYVTSSAIDCKHLCNIFRFYSVMISCRKYCTNNIFKGIKVFTKNCNTKCIYYSNILLQNGTLTTKSSINFKFRKILIEKMPLYLCKNLNPFWSIFMCQLSEKSNIVLPPSIYSSKTNIWLPRNTFPLPHLIKDQLIRKH